MRPTVLVLSDHGFTEGGGAEYYSEVLSTGLRKANIPTITASIDSDDSLLRLRTSKGIAGRLYDHSLISHLKSVKEEFTINIIHANILDQPHALAVMMGAKKLGVPYVATVHSCVHLCPTEYYVRLPEFVPCSAVYFNMHCARCITSGLRTRGQSVLRNAISYLRVPYNMYVFRAFLRNASIVISPSKTYTNLLLKVGIGSVYLPHPLSANSIGPEPDDDGSILFIGRLEWEKGATLLPEMARKLPNHIFHVVGKGSLSKWLEERKMPNIVQHGYVSDRAKQHLISKCTLVVVPSLWCDLFNYVVSEALASGKPVVSFDIGGPKEQIESSSGGLLATPFDMIDFIEKVKYLLENTDEAREMGIRGRSWVLKTLKPENYIKKTLSVYHSVLKRRTGN